MLIVFNGAGLLSAFLNEEQPEQWVPHVTKEDRKENRES